MIVGIFMTIFLIIFSLLCSFGGPGPSKQVIVKQIMPFKDKLAAASANKQTAPPTNKQQEAPLSPLKGILLPEKHKKSDKHVRFADTRTTITGSGRRVKESAYSKAALGARAGDYA